MANVGSSIEWPKSILTFNLPAFNHRVIRIGVRSPLFPIFAQFKEDLVMFSRIFGRISSKVEAASANWHSNAIQSRRIQRQLRVTAKLATRIDHPPRVYRVEDSDKMLR